MTDEEAEITRIVEEAIEKNPDANNDQILKIVHEQRPGLAQSRVLAALKKMGR